MMNGANALDMTLYDYTAALHCWSKANNPDAAPPQLSDDEQAELEAEAAEIDWSVFEGTE